MTNVLPIEGDGSVEQTLKDVLEAADKVEVVIVLALNRDGTQFIRSSKGNMLEKCFLKCGLDTFISGWFAEGLWEKP